MAAPPANNIWTSSGRLRLETLILIRWIAIAGQTGGVLFVEWVLGLHVLLGPALGVIAMSAWVNVFLMVARQAQGPVREWEAAGQLAYDLVQLALLLGFTGGVQNPFTVLFIAPVAISATVLRPKITSTLAAVALLCVAAISLWHAPLPWTDGAMLELPALYRWGLAAAAATGIVFTGIYAWRVAQEEERMTLALAATEAVLAREQRLSALGGLAAAAAHELGTPLATIHLVAKEMARTLPADSPLAEDAALLVSQAERCRSILRQLAAHPDEGDIVYARAPLQALLEEAAEPHMNQGAEIVITCTGPDSEKPPSVKRMPEVLHGLSSLVENAVSFARTRVEIRATWDAERISVTIRDDGAGFPPDVLPRLGSPYVSMRRTAARGKEAGLGLGFFIAKTLVERSGGAVLARNRTPPASGAVVRVDWARSSIEAPPL